MQVTESLYPLLSITLFFFHSRFSLSSHRPSFRFRLLPPPCPCPFKLYFPSLHTSKLNYSNRYLPVHLLLSFDPFPSISSRQLARLFEFVSSRILVSVLSHTISHFFHTSRPVSSDKSLYIFSQPSFRLFTLRSLLSLIAYSFPSLLLSFHILSSGTSSPSYKPRKG